MPNISRHDKIANLAGMGARLPGETPDRTLFSHVFIRPGRLGAFTKCREPAHLLYEPALALRAGEEGKNSANWRITTTGGVGPHSAVPAPRGRGKRRPALRFRRGGRGRAIKGRFRPRR